MNNNYIEVNCPSHPHARSNGTVYEHRLVAEKKLGRYLLPTEIVHHLDENKTNNIPENLIVFKTNADHSAFHKGKNICQVGDVWIAYDKSVKMPGVTTLYNVCPICNHALKSSNAKMCLRCRNLSRSYIKPDKNTLLKLILKYPICKIGEMFSVSDNAVRKWCKSYDLPSKYNDIKKLKLEMA